MQLPIVFLILTLLCFQDPLLHSVRLYSVARFLAFWLSRHSGRSKGCDNKIQDCVFHSSVYSATLFFFAPFFCRHSFRVAKAFLDQDQKRQTLCNLAPPLLTKCTVDRSLLLLLSNRHPPTTCIPNHHLATHTYQCLANNPTTQKSTNTN